MVASKKDHLEIVEFLIEKGADLNARDSDGDTALILAANQENNEIVKILVEKVISLVLRVNFQSSQDDKYCWKKAISYRR